MTTVTFYIPIAKQFKSQLQQRHISTKTQKNGQIWQIIISN